MAGSGLGELRDLACNPDVRKRSLDHVFDETGEVGDGEDTVGWEHIDRRLSEVSTLIDRLGFARQKIMPPRFSLRGGSLRLHGQRLSSWRPVRRCWYWAEHRQWPWQLPQQSRSRLKWQWHGASGH